VSLTAAQLFANVGLSGAASTVAGLKGVGAQVNATHTGMGRLGGAATSLKNNMLGLGKSLALGMGIAGIGSIAGALEQGISKADELGLAVEKLTGVTGLSVHSASQLIAVFSKFGIATDRTVTIAGFAEKTLGKLAVTHATAAKSAALLALETQKLNIQVAGGSVKAVDLAIAHRKALDALAATGAGASKLTVLDKQYGLSLVDSKGKVVDFAAELNQVANFYNSNASASDKATVAAQLFGRGYVALIPILKLGSKGIAEATAQADAMGLTLKSAQDVQNVHDFIAAQRDARDAIAGLEVQLGLLVMPDLTVALKAFVGYIGGHQDDIKRMFSDGLHTAEAFVGVITGTVIPAVQAIAGVVTGVWNAIPGPLKQILVGGFVANKLTGGLVTGLAGDLTKTLLGIGGRAVGGAAGGALAGLGATHVWVDNMGVGGLGGGAGGAAGAAEAAAGGSLLVGGLAVGGIVAGVAVAAQQALDLHDARANIAGQYKLTNAQALALQLSQMSPENRQQSMSHGAANEFLREGTTYQAALAAAQAAVTAVAAVTSASKTSAPTQAGVNAFRSGERATVTSGHLSSQISAALEHPLKANAVDMANGITSAFKESMSPNLFSMESALGQIKTMQARFVAQGDTALAAKLSAGIAYLAGRVDAVTQAINLKQFIATGILGSPSLTGGTTKVTPVPVKLTLDGRGVASGLVRYNTVRSSG
jgi:hypothetical protein